MWSLVENDSRFLTALYLAKYLAVVNVFKCIYSIKL